METKLSHSQEFIEWTIIWIDIAKSSFESDMQQVEESIKERDEKIRKEAVEEYKQWLLLEIKKTISWKFTDDKYKMWLIRSKKIIKSYTLPTK